MRPEMSKRAFAWIAAAEAVLGWTAIGWMVYCYFHGRQPWPIW
jgi:hypothetical protein